MSPSCRLNLSNNLSTQNRCSLPPADGGPIRDWKALMNSEEPMSALLQEFAHTLLTEFCIELIRHYRSTGESSLLDRQVEMMSIWTDGAPFPGEVTSGAVTTEGPVLFTEFVHDLIEKFAFDAEREELEGRLHQMERLESLGLLAGSVAHDFNNLLTVILNDAVSITEAAPASSPTKAHAEGILASAKRAAALTKQITMYTRREPVRHTAVDLNLVVEQIRDLVANTIGSHIRVEVQAAADLPLIHADRGQIEQVLMNLSVNARDAMHNGGTLTIETALVELRADEAKPHLALVPRAYVQLTVSDDGAGMSAELVPQIFDPFFSTKPREEGTGIGLATVNTIVADAGGTVEVQSEEGVGTTVRAFFPASLDTPATSPESVDEVVGASEMVLVVEGQPAVRETTVAMLRRNGYRVRHAADTAEPCASRPASTSTCS